MKKLSKIVLREHISQEDFVSKKAQKYLLGGSGGGGGNCSIKCNQSDEGTWTHGNDCSRETVAAECGHEPTSNTSCAC